jgi:hypothetical protein
MSLSLESVTLWPQPGSCRPSCAEGPCSETRGTGDVGEVPVRGATPALRHPRRQVELRQVGQTHEGLVRQTVPRRPRRQHYVVDEGAGQIGGAGSVELRVAQRAGQIGARVEQAVRGTAVLEQLVVDAGDDVVGDHARSLRRFTARRVGASSVSHKVRV